MKRHEAEEFDAMDDHINRQAGTIQRLQRELASQKARLEAAEEVCRLVEMRLSRREEWRDFDEVANSLNAWREAGGE